MRPIEFELERTIRAPVEQVFARLIDIEGHNDWMAGTGSMLRRTHQTSPGEPTIGTTFIDETSQGTTPGEIAEMEAPHTLVYHWWEKSKSGKLKFEGWPSYHLQPAGDNETLVRHRGKLVSYGVWRLGTPIWRRFAVKERAITVDALKASFERGSDPAARLTAEDLATSSVAALLSRYQQAWTDGDIDAIVEMTAPDGVYEASFGPNPWGERFVGPDEIRAALVRMRIGEPGGSRHEYAETHIVGDCAFAMWRSVLDGTDGPVVTMHGADFYRFRDGKVAAKIAYRKRVEGSP